MRLHRDDSVVYVPDGLDADAGLARTTHLCIGAHQDDQEIMAIEGILACYTREDAFFAGVVVNDGAGAPRAGQFAGYTDEQMAAARIEEQKRAADIGKYGAQILLGWPNEPVKSGEDTRPVDDIETILRAAQPEIVYTHNLMDKHDTHVAVALKTVAAIRRLPATERPSKLYGGEVWRDLDWLVGGDKVIFDASDNEDLQLKLLQVFETQVAGGKRYDLAAMGRRKAHATYLEPLQVDNVTGAVYGVDMTPLIENDTLDPAEFALGFVDNLRDDVEDRIARMS